MHTARRDGLPNGFRRGQSNTSVDFGLGTRFAGRLSSHVSVPDAVNVRRILPPDALAGHS